MLEYGEDEELGSGRTGIGLKINTGVFLNKKESPCLDWRGLYYLGCVELVKCKVNVMQFYSAWKTV